MGKERVQTVYIKKVKEAASEEKMDLLAVEEPLEIRLGFGASDIRQQKSLAITMRTPGNDLELVLGFLFTEGIISNMEDVIHIDHCTDNRNQPSENVVRVELDTGKKVNWEDMQRHFYTNSSCGICGKASIESLEKICLTKVSTDVSIAPEIIHSLSAKMREGQSIFEYTGGLHASALFNDNGDLLYMREDIGRHNALDKIIGAALFEKRIPLQGNIIMLSGRSCYELIQKAVMAGVPVVAAVGAPSSLAVQTARNFGVTLLGFTKSGTFNIYSGSERIVL